MVYFGWWVFIIISLRGEVWAHKTSLFPPPLIEVPIPSQESEHFFVCICVLGYRFFLFLRFWYLILEWLLTVWYFSIDFGMALTVWYFSIDFGMVLTVWYFSIDFGMVLTVWYFSIDFGMALTVWYFLSFILLQSFTEFVQLYCDYQTYLGRKSW